MTVEELEAQIKSLLKQLKELQTSLGIEKKIKSMELKEDPIVVYNNKKADKYFKELRSIKNKNEKIINQGKDKKIKITINYPDVAKKAEKELKKTKKYEWEITNEYKISREEKLLNKKYKDCLPAVGGVGGPDGWIDVAIHVSLFIFYSWILKHILGEIDAKLWNEFKKIISNIYKLIKPKKGKAKNDFLVVPSYHLFSRDHPTIIFSMPIGLEEETVLGALDEIPKKTRELLIEYADKEVSSLTFRFKFIPKRKGWARDDDADRILKMK